MVGLVIKLMTFLLGLHECVVHLPALLCWVFTAYYLYKWAELIRFGIGKNTLMLFAILPFFFLQSMAITPDPLVMTFWAGALYSFYNALVLNKAKHFYYAGIWIGLGLLSKYTISLLILPTIAYCLIIKPARYWLRRKELYLGALISLLIFSPVIYWNYTHEWASFLFQTVHRFNAPKSLSLHKFLGLLLFLLSPLGLWQLLKLLSDRSKLNILSLEVYRFLQLFTFLPLSVFAWHSFTHPVKFDWAGPGLLAALPWFSLLSARCNNFAKINFAKFWNYTALILLCCYLIAGSTLALSYPDTLYKKFLARYFSWKNLIVQLNHIGTQVAISEKESPIFVPLDAYNIASELNFYQALLYKQHKINKIYPVIGRNIFNCENLMYKYWFSGENLSNRILILITSDTHDFDILNIKYQTLDKSPVHIIWAYSQNNHKKIKPYYYKIVQMKPYQKFHWA